MRIATLSRIFALTALLAAPAVGYAAACDVDNDGDIDRDDLSAIIAARNTPASGPDDARDGNGDGVINVLDARFCVLRCTLPGCASPSTNSAPIASAGADQTAFVLDTVTLDGSASSDADGDALTFAWSLSSAPIGSIAALDDPTAVMPSFQLDAPGNFVVQLIVNDGALDSAADTVTVSTLNSAPMADAGPNQTAFVLDTVTLDGGGSSDVDGDALTYSWSLASVPPGSIAALDDASVVMPSFVIDLPGDYLVELVVNDGSLDSVADTVVVSTLNSPPVSDAGPNQTALVLDTVTLDGSGSTDVDGDALSFSWNFSSLPAGSSAALDDPAAVMPVFQIDLPGDYIAQLVVNDGSVDSAPDTVVVSTLNSAPTADAGADQSVFVNDLVFLDGSGSSDPDLDPLTFAWSLTSVPAGSLSMLDDPTSPTPGFTVDTPGDYVAQLIVNDGLVDSGPDTTTISTDNVAPIADAGVDQVVHQGATVLLDGFGSSDPNFDALTFSWSFTTVPAGSTAAFDDATSPTPSFVADRTGTYTMQLIVNDGFVDSAPDTVVVTSENIAPVAIAGPDQTVPHGTTVILDGTLSFDPDSDPLTFSWTLTAPAGSTAAFDDATSPTPSFVADLPGSYTVGLVVNDDFVDSTPDTVEITSENLAPVADAGPDQTVSHGTPVILDGTLSFDPDSDPLTFTWTLTAPAGSTAAFDDATSPTPSFVADLPGSYTVDLVVNDGFVDSAPDSVVVTSENIVPVAIAGPDQTVAPGATVILDGTLSFDPDSDPLTFLWTLTAPAGSTAAFDDATSPSPSFVADLPGSYTVDLVVNDGFVDSAPDSVTVTTSASPAFAIDDPVVVETNAGTTSLVFTITLPAPATVLASVDVATTGGTATPGSDYTAFPLTTINFGIGDSSQTVSVTISGDQTVELDETVILQLSNPTGAQVTDPEGDGTILNDDTASLSIDDVSLAEGDAGSVDFLFTVTLDNAVDTGVTVDFATVDGSAFAGSDYVAAAGTLAFAGTAGETQTVTVPVNGDTTVELDETASVQLSSVFASGRDVSLGDDVGELGISNDDAASLSIDDVSLAEGDAGSVDFLFTVTLDNAVDTGVTVDFATADGSAFAGSDYVAAAGTLTFAGTAGETQTVTVPVNGDTDIEPDEDFFVDLSALQASGRDVTFADAQGAGSVLNDDAALATITLTPPTLALSTLDSGALTVTLSAAAGVGGQTVVVTATPPGIVTVPASVVVPEAATSTSLPVDAGTTGGSATVTASAGGFSDGSATVAVTARDLSISTAVTLIGVTRTVSGTVTLALPAPAGGVSVTVTSLNEMGTATIAPGTVVIAPGTTQGVFDVTGVAGGNTTIQASAPGYGTASTTVTVTNSVVNLPETLAVPLGQVNQLPIGIAPGVAPAGGVTVNLSSSNPTIASLPASVFIAAGEFLASVDIDGNLPGTVTVTGDAIGYAIDTTEVTVSAEFNIIETSTTATPTFPATVTIRLESSGAATAAPSDITVNLVSSDPGCVAPVTPVTIGTGLVTTLATLNYGGSASLPCSAVVTAQDSGVIVSDTVNMTVNPDPPINIFAAATTVGAGLQVGSFGGNLGLAGHGGVTLRIASSDPTRVLVAPNASAAGAAFVDISQSDGDATFGFYVQAVEGTTGGATVTASAPGFQDDTLAVTVVQPSFDLNGVQTSIDTLDPDDAFFVRVGIPNTGGTAIVGEQAARAGGGGLSVTVAVTDATVAELVTTSTAAGTATLSIPEGLARTPSTVAAGGVALSPLTAGTTDVSGSIPGFALINSSTRTVTVTAPTMSFTGITRDVGAGLQSGRIGGTLSASQHGGVTVRITSDDPTRVLVAPNASTLGTAFIDRTVTNGAVNFSFFVQGLESTTGTATLTLSIVSGATFVPINTMTVDVLQPSFDLNGVQTSIDTLDPDDAFFVRVGIPNTGGTAIVGEQAARAGGGGLSVTVAVTDATVAELVTTSTAAGTATLSIPEGLARTPSTVAAGGVALSPLTAGTTDVSGSISGFGLVNNSTRTVTVTAPTMSFTGTTRDVGAGLQSGRIGGTLSASQHGGVTVRITSDDPTRVLVAPNASTLGTAFIDRTVTNGAVNFSFFAQGLESTTGTATLTLSIVSGATFVPINTMTVDVLQPSFDLNGVQTSIDTLDPDDVFFVRVGIPNTGGTAIVGEQAARAGGGGLSVTVAVTDATVAELVTTSTAAGTATLSIPEGLARTPSTVAAGGVALSPLTAGTTDVSGSIPGFGLVNNSTRTVTVTTPSVNMSDISGDPVGAGLQDGNYSALLSASQHGGTTVRIESSNVAVVLVAPNGSIAGTSFIDVPLANGQTLARFFIQGVPGAGGNTALITATATGFLSDTTTVDVVQPAMRINGLGTSPGAGAADDAFTTTVGRANSGSTNLAEVESVRTGGGALTVTLTNSNAVAGQLVTTASTGQSVTVEIAEASSSSPSNVASGGVAFDPLAVGQTLVGASAAGFISTDAASVIVDVGP